MSLQHSYFKNIKQILVLALLVMFSACTGHIPDPVDELDSQETSEMSQMTEMTETTVDPETSESTETTETTVDPETSESTEQTTDPVETANPEETTEPEPNEEEVEPNFDQIDRESFGEDEGEVVHLLEPEAVPVLERPRRRMNLEQLDRAIQQVSGGLIWSERQNNNDVNLFESLSSTLGKPDYIQQTHEDLTPSSLFIKFLDDAARQVCGKRIDLDLEAIANPQNGVNDPQITLWGTLVPEETSQADAEAVNQQIRALVLRFHSHDLPQGESPRLAYWRWLFETASLVDHNPISGWRALCIGLITHPDFYSY